MADEQLELLVTFSLQVVSSQILGFDIGGAHFDLTSEEVGDLHAWAVDPTDEENEQQFRTILVARYGDTFTQETNLQDIFGPLFLYIKCTVLMSERHNVSVLDLMLDAFDHRDFPFPVTIHESYNQPRALVVILRELLVLCEDNEMTSLDERRRVLSERLLELVADVGVPQFIFPIFSDAHASYGCCERTPDGFRIAVCNGDIGQEYFYDQKVFPGGNLGHCIVQVTVEEMEMVLQVVAAYYDDGGVFETIGISFDWANRRLDSVRLFAGEIDGFAGLEVSMRKQLTDNCALYNLLHAIRFATRSYPKTGGVFGNVLDMNRQLRCLNYAAGSLEGMSNLPELSHHRASIEMTLDQLRHLITVVRAGIQVYWASV